MGRETFAIVIGVLSCIGHIILGIFTILNVIHITGHKENVTNYGTHMFVLCLSLVFQVLMCLLSVLLVMGVRKKRQDWIGPWVIFCAIGICCSILNLIISGFIQPALELFKNLIYIAITAAVWYPIYTLWRDMRKTALNVPRRPGQPNLPAAQQAAYAAPPAYPADPNEYRPVPQKV